MFVGSNLEFWPTFNSSKRPFVLGFLYGAVVAAASYFTDYPIAFPWAPIGIIGIAVSLYLGFKNNSTYDRFSQARKVWSTINQNSRSFGAAVVSFVQGPRQEEIRKELIYRHLAWITILRYRLRLRKPWEHAKDRLEHLYAPTQNKEYYNRLNHELVKYISKEEIARLASMTNESTQTLRIQSQRLQELCNQGMFDSFRHMELQKMIREFYISQGQADGIKNFPFPRRYSSAARWITVVFCAFVPLGLIDILEEESTWEIWVCPFLSGLMIWLFMFMERIGSYSENPYEGTRHDVPISAIARIIEIDLREMLDEKRTPPMLRPDEDGYLM